MHCKIKEIFDCDGVTKLREFRWFLRSFEGRGGREGVKLFVCIFFLYILSYLIFCCPSLMKRILIRDKSVFRILISLLCVF